MTQADSVLSTPPTNTSAKQSRRSILGAIAAGSIATLASAVAEPAIADALPVAAPAMPVVESSPVDAELLKLADDYIAAEQKWCDLNLKVVRMEGEFMYRREPVPDVLQWRESDAEIGTLYQFPKDHPPIWDRPVDVDRLRETKWLAVTKIETEDELTVTIRRFLPSDAARARADEIVAAYDEWHKEGKPPRGYKKAVREKDRAARAYNRIEKQIAAMRAQTIEGMMAKIRCAQAYEKSDEIDAIDGGSCAEVMSISIFQDLQQMAKTA